jgi:hypothetical protein
VGDDLYVPEDCAAMETAETPASSEADTADEPVSPDASTAGQPASPGAQHGPGAASRFGPSYLEMLGSLFAVAVGVAIFVVAWRAYKRSAVTPPSVLRAFLS